MIPHWLRPVSHAFYGLHHSHLIPITHHPIVCKSLRQVISDRKTKTSQSMHTTPTTFLHSNPPHPTLTSPTTTPLPNKTRQGRETLSHRTPTPPIIPRIILLLVPLLILPNLLLLLLLPIRPPILRRIRSQPSHQRSEPNIPILMSRVPIPEMPTSHPSYHGAG